MPTIVQAAVDAFAKRAGMAKKSGTWYLPRDETILVLNLQKSNYATRYYLNVGIWLRPVDPADFPKEPACHIRTRLSRLAPDATHADRLLDVEWVAAHGDALDELDLLLKTTIGPVIDATESLAKLRSDAGQSFLKRALLTAGAQRVLADGAP